MEFWQMLYASSRGNN